MEQLKVAFPDGNLNPLSVTLNKSIALETGLAVHLLSRFIEGAECLLWCVHTWKCEDLTKNYSMCIYTGDSNSLD